MNDLKTFDELIGFGKPASKTADWIVNTYLPNAPVSYRLSIEHAIAQAIVDAHPGIVPGWADRDRLWCEALVKAQENPDDIRMVERVTRIFNELRPDAAPDKGEGKKNQDYKK